MFLKKATIIIIILVNILFANEFGKDVKVKGIWKIKTAKTGQAITLVSAVGYNIALKFTNDGKVYKVNYKTLKGNISHHTWKILKNGILNIKYKTQNKNIIANFIFKSVYNDYIKIFKKINKNCYKVAIQNNNNKVSKYGAIMCKIE